MTERPSIRTDTGEGGLEIMKGKGGESQEYIFLRKHLYCDDQLTGNFPSHSADGQVFLAENFTFALRAQ